MTTQLHPLSHRHAAIGHAADGSQMPMVIALALSAVAGPVSYWTLVRPWKKQEV